MRSTIIIIGIELTEFMVAFLGNHFLQVLGENFSAHSISNPDPESEKNLLSQLAPEMDPKLIRRLVAAFQDLRLGYESGTLNYPYSLRGEHTLPWISGGKAERYNFRTY